MAVIFPESVTRLQATALVSDAELASVGRSGVIQHAAREMAEKALLKILADCTKTGQYLGYQTNKLTLDVCVIEPEEFLLLLADARAQGERDALRWKPSLTGKP